MDCGVICFRAAVRKERFLQAARSDLRQLLREIRLWFVAVKRRSMRDTLDLIDDRVVNHWVSMTDAYRKHAAEAVEVFVAPIVPDMKAFAAYQRQRFLVISGDRGKEKFLVFANGVGWCGLWLW